MNVLKTIWLLIFAVVSFSASAQQLSNQKKLTNNAYFYMQQQQFDQAIQTAKQLPQVYEKYLLLGAAYMNKLYLRQ